MSTRLPLEPNRRFVCPSPANNYNDENIFVLGSPYADLPKSEGGPTDPVECAALTGFFRSEIDRIIADLSDPYAA
jgi:hypothetical protein